MSLEKLLKPAKWLDEQVLRQYTKVAKKLKLDKGNRRYLAACPVWLSGLLLCALAEDKLFGTTIPLRLGINIFDFGHNFEGATDQIDNETQNPQLSIDPKTFIYKKLNSSTRLPVFTAGLGFTGTFLVDLYQKLKHGEPIDPKSYDQLQYGLGLIALASSMYIKETDPKLLQKDSAWKTAYNRVKEKVDSLAPQPIPQPTYSTTYATIDSIVDAS